MKRLLLTVTLTLLLTACTQQLAVVDRIDNINQYAVLELEGNTYYNVLLKDLPQEVKEGTVIIITKDGFYIDSKETAKKKEEITKLLDEMYDYPDTPKK